MRLVMGFFDCRFLQSAVHSLDLAVCPRVVRLGQPVLDAMLVADPESFTDPERDPLQAELFENPPEIADGWLTLNEAPGLGLTLSEAALKKFGEQIL